jgi:hypothetical protein
MAKTRAFTHAFNQGEVSANALVRVDQEKLRLAAEQQRNILPAIIGAGMMRPGYGYTGASKSNNQARGIPFIRSTTDFADLELTNTVLRVWVDDTPITRPTATSTVTNGDFASGTGWTLTVGTGATGNINSTVSGALYMTAAARGSSVTCTRSVTTSSADTEHALRIEVTRGPVFFRCGSTSGGDDYIEETELDTGTHSLAFTPSGTYHVFFKTQRETAVIVDSITVESAGVMEITAPWTTSELRDIRFDQSIDVVYLAHGNWQTRLVERRGTRSWSLVLFKADDGPFTIARTANVRIKPDATRGNTTLTAESNFFRPEHVGTLFRIFHDRFDADFVLAGDGIYTDAWRVTGVRIATYANERSFAFQSTGTWSGTLTMQRSVDGEDTGFNDFPIDDSTATVSSTANVNNVHDGEDADNNVIAWHRLGFLPGDYTSGSITIDAQYNGHSGFGVARVTAYTSATSVSVEVLRDFKDTTYSDNWLEGEWSDRRGWPTAVAFFDGRLWFMRDDKFWGSESDGFTLFNLETEGDSGSIQRNIATGGSVNTGIAMLALQRLMLMTAGSESSARASSFDEPLTPTNTSVKDASTQGSASVSPVKLDGRGIFVQKSGTKLYEILYNFEANDYTSRNLNRLNDEIGGDGIVELAVQRQPETFIWGVREDGIEVLLIYDDSEEALGWFTVETDGQIESAFVLPGTTQDRVYAWIKRTIGASTVRYREKLALHSEALGATVTKLADSGIYTSSASTAVTAAHLYGSTESLIGWGTSTAGVKTVLTGLSVSTATTAGIVSLGASYTDSWVGLSYSGRYKSAKLAYGAQGGTALLQQKAVHQAGLVMSNVHKDAIKVGPNFDSLTKFDIRKANRQAFGSTDDPVVSGHDTVMQPMGGTWDTDSRVCIEIQPGHPATLNALVFNIDTNE